MYTIQNIFMHPCGLKSLYAQRLLSPQKDKMRIYCYSLARASENCAPKIFGAHYKLSSLVCEQMELNSIYVMLYFFLSDHYNSSGSTFYNINVYVKWMLDDQIIDRRN